MSTTPEHPVWLDGMIADLEQSIEADKIRLDLARQLRSTYTADATVSDPAEPEPTSAPAKPAARPKKKTPKPSKTAVDETYRCEQCGETRPSKRSLGQHRRHCSGAAPAAPASKPHVTAVESPAEPIEAPRHFVCTTCDAKAGSREALAKHTDTQHHRGLKADEHWAKDGAA